MPKKRAEKTQGPFGFFQPLFGAGTERGRKKPERAETKTKKGQKETRAKKGRKKFKGAERNPEGQTKTTTVGGNLLSR